MNDVGKELRRIRREHGFAMKQLADKAMLDINTIQGWETGRHSPSVEALGWVLDVLGMELCIRERKTEEKNGGKSNE